MGVLYIGTMDGLMIYNLLLENKKLYRPVTNIINVKLFYTSLVLEALRQRIIIKDKKDTYPDCMVNKDLQKFISIFDADNKAIFIKAIKNLIGIYIKQREFVTHEIKLERNDQIYLFTDGYID